MGRVRPIVPGPESDPPDQCAPTPLRGLCPLDIRIVVGGNNAVGELDRVNQAVEFASACPDIQVVSVCDREGAVRSVG